MIARDIFHILAALAAIAGAWILFSNALANVVFG